MLAYEATGSSSDDSPLLFNTASRQDTGRQSSLWIYTLLFVDAWGASLQNVPRLQLYQNIICRRYYSPMVGNVGVPFSLDCEINAVRNELMLLVGWQKFLLGVVPGEYNYKSRDAQFLTRPSSAIFSILFAICANSVGRRNILALALLGITLSQMWVMVVCTSSSIPNARLFR